MTLPTGTRLGSYEVLAPLGAGGMGEVYRARDSRLHRDVAIKILPESFALDPDRLARFQREAQVLASLNHTNIAHVYGLEKDPKRRLHDIADARLDLEEALTAPTQDVAATAVQPSSGRVRWIWPAALVGASSLAALVTWGATRPGVAPPPPVQRLTIAVPSTAPFAGSELAVSPDGKRIVYPTAGTQALLYMRELDRLDVQPIKGTEAAAFPFFSPDGEWVGFSAGGKLKKVSIRGGPPVTLCDVPGAGVAASWGSDDTVVFSSAALLGQGLLRVSAAGGIPTPLTTATEGRHRLPVFVPGRKAVLFTVLGAGGPTYDSAKIAVLSLETGTYRTVIERGYHARVISSGHVVYAAGNTLMAVAFDPDRLEARGPAVPVVEGVGPVGSASNIQGSSAFDVSRDGLLVYAPSGAASGQHTLVWVDREGREQATNVPPHSYRYPRLSPDGTRIAVDVKDQGSDIWIWDSARQTLSRLTLTGINALAAWTPDSRRIIFASTRDGGTYNLFWQAADGSGNPERLTKSALPQFPYRTTPDGKQLVIQEGDRASVNINLLSLDGDRKATPLLATAANEQSAAVSPDSRWIAYSSDESGRYEVYVRPFPRIGDGRRQVSTGGGGGPVWMSSGRELSYVRQNGSMLEVWVVPMKDGAADRAPQMLFRGAYMPFLNLNHDVTPDGRRFLMVKSVGEQSESASTDFVAVLNWAEELKRLASARSR